MTTPTKSRRGRKPISPGSDPAVEAARLHGLSARFALAPEENPEEFQSLVDFFFTTFHPADRDACFAVLGASMAVWMLRRAVRIQAALSAVAGPDATAVSARLERYKAAHRRALSRALATLGGVLDAAAGDGPGGELKALLDR